MKIEVYGYPRAGNHLLARSIKLNWPTATVRMRGHDLPPERGRAIYITRPYVECADSLLYMTGGRLTREELDRTPWEALYRRGRALGLFRDSVVWVPEALRYTTPPDLHARLQRAWDAAEELAPSRIAVVSYSEMDKWPRLTLRGLGDRFGWPKRSVFEVVTGKADPYPSRRFPE